MNGNGFIIYCLLDMIYIQKQAHIENYFYCFCHLKRVDIETISLPDGGSTIIIGRGSKTKTLESLFYISDR